MRTAILLPLLIFAAPAAAQSTSPVPETEDLQRMLSDPTLTDRMSNAMQSLSKAFLSLPVGEVQAAVEGREPNAADRRRTIRTESKISERELKRQIDQAKPQIEAGMKALASSLPAMMESLKQAGDAIERAAANMPDPTYPKR